MANEQKMVIKSPMVAQDTTADALFHRLDKAAKLTGESFHAGETMRLAACSFWLDLLGVTDQGFRTEIAKVAMATPGWFMCGNNSACRQAREKKVPAHLKEYLV